MGSMPFESTEKSGGATFLDHVYSISNRIMLNDVTWR